MLVIYFVCLFYLFICMKFILKTCFGVPFRYYCNSHWLATGQSELTGPPYVVNTNDMDRHFVFNVQGSDFQPTAVKCAAVWVNESSVYRWITLDNCATTRSLYSIYFKFERDAATLSNKVQIIYSIHNM